MNREDIFYSAEKFERYGPSYFTALILLSIAGIILIVIGKKANERNKIRLSNGIPFLLSSVIIIWGLIEVVLGRFYLETDLPLIFCNFTALFLPLYIYYRNQTLFDILYYIILVGAIQSIITPGLKFNFPHYEFLKFWTVHVGLVFFILYEIIVLNRKPTYKGVFITFLWIQVYVVFNMLINWMLDANYLYLNIKPEHGTLLDLLGGWPWYIIWMDVILIPYFLILYLPVWLLQKMKPFSK